MEADRQGIGIEYDVSLNRLVASVPEYIVVEIIGILWDNALDYLMQIESKQIYIGIQESQNEMSIIIQNPIVNISYNDIAMFFRKNYSEKEGHEGFGLSKLLKYKEQYHLQVNVEKICVKNKEWVSIRVIL